MESVNAHTRQPEVSPALPSRVATVARSMVTADLLAKTAIQFAIGGAILAASWIVPAWAASYVHLAGVMGLMFAVYQLIGHAYGKFTAHVLSWLKHRRERWRTRDERNRTRMAQLAYCRRCCCGSCEMERWSKEW